MQLIAPVHPIGRGIFAYPKKPVSIFQQHIGQWHASQFYQFAGLGKIPTWFFFLPTTTRQVERFLTRDLHCIPVKSAPNNQFARVSSTQVVRPRFARLAVHLPISLALEGATLPDYNRFCQPNRAPVKK